MTTEAEHEAYFKELIMSIGLTTGMLAKGQNQERLAQALKNGSLRNDFIILLRDKLTAALNNKKINKIDELVMWVIYDHPKDYPDDFVARKWIINKDGEVSTKQILLAKTIGAIRKDVMFAMPNLPDCIDRSIDDDPHIVESWI